MLTVHDVALRADAIALATTGVEVFARFEADEDLVCLAVLDEVGAPAGLIERNRFMQKFGSNYGRALYAGRPVSMIMDTDMLVVDVTTPVSEFASRALADRPSDLMRGFVAVAQDRFVGVGSGLALLQALADENRRHALELQGAKIEAQAASELLSEALDAMGEGVAVFDAQDRFVLWNGRYADMVKDSADVLAKGCPLGDLLADGVAKGSYPEAEGRDRAWVEQRLSRRAALKDRSSEEQAQGGDRWMRLEETRLKSGGCISVAVDITELRRREASFRLLFENNPVPLVLFDAEALRIVAANEAVEAQFGYTPQALAALDVRTLAQDLGADEDGAEPGAFKRLLTAGGEARFIRCYRHPTTYDGRPATLVAAVDVTAQLRSEQALKEAVVRAEAADQAKSEFLANMSHELRTPLNGVIGMASVLARTPLDARQGEMVQTIRTAAASLETLLSDVLDLAKIEAGHLQLQEERVTPAALVRHLAALFGAPSREKGLSFDVDLDAASEEAVLADGVRLAQILTNLCSNAVKFTDAGAVRLAARTETRGERRSVVFEVSDTGIGLTPEAQARIFQRFAQADGSITRRFGGTGLGLAICEQLSVMMGGEITVRSAVGQGSTFRLALDLPAAERQELAALAPPTPARAEAAPEADGRRLRVLLVEDHPVNRQVVQIMLGELVDLDIAEYGAEAVQAFAASSYDLILMDMQMPVMDGLTATRQIRDTEAREGRLPTPVVMLTANALPEHLRRSREAGADAHLAKPITAEALFDCIERVLATDTSADVEVMASAA